MAMKAKVTKADVLKAVAEIEKGVKVFGRQFSPRLSSQELAELLLVAVQEGNYEGPTREEHTKLSRQLAACTSREKALRAKLAGEPVHTYSSENEPSLI